MRISGGYQLISVIITRAKEPLIVFNVSKRPVSNLSAFVEPETAITSPSVEVGKIASDPQGLAEVHPHLLLPL